MNMVERFAKNETGRDFVVGDIHGCFDKLEAEMLKIHFDKTKDRLFSVGDLVDRGPDSLAAILWLSFPWFHAVRGNHEQMAIGVANGKHDHDNYRINGGAWFLELGEATQAACADLFDQLPFAIQIETKNGLIGIVHAECAGQSWQQFCNALENPPSNNKLRAVTEMALWSRDKITQKDDSRIKELYRLYVGHTPLREVEMLGNVVYVDTGAVFGRSLSLLRIN